MNVTIDISSIVYHRGVSRYTSNLTQALMKEKGVTVHLFGSAWRQFPILSEYLEDLKLSQQQYRLIHMPPKALTFSWYTLNYPPIDSIISKTDVFHAWEELIPPTKNTPIVATIHDLAILKFPQTAHPDTLYKHRQAWKRLKSLNSHIIAVSESTRTDVIQLLHFPEDHVHTVYEALPEEVKISPSDSVTQRVLNTYTLNKPFILFVGTREPRKNLSRLIKAWQQLSQDVDLVIVGEKGWGEEDFNSANQVNKKNTVHFLGKVSDEELASLYKESSVFAYPSLHEGFGLPILEAYFHHTPVLTSNVSSMPEVAGACAELVNPESVEEIAKGLSTLINESPVKKKARIEIMNKQLEKFSWKKTAKQTIEVYKKVMKNSDK